MTLLPRKGEIIEQSVKVDTPVGKGIVYVTSMGLVLAISGKGIYVDLKHEIITSLINTIRNKIVVSWMEDSINDFSFEFRLKDAEVFAKSISEKYRYTENFSGDPTQKIPPRIPQDKRWGDAYYDEQRKAYVTLNKVYEEFEDVRNRDIQVQYDREMGSNAGIIIDESEITIKYGIPAFLVKNQNGNPIWLLLPNMTDEMLTDEIVKNRLRSKSYDNSVIYETVSEAWLSMGSQALMLTERKRKVGVKIGLYADVPMELLKVINFHSV